MKANTILLTIILSVLSPLVFSANCNISPVEEEKLLSMSYDIFDQSEYGWRQYAKEGCYCQTGVLIDKYLDKNKNLLQDWQLIGITWHAGQLYAFDNDYETAKLRFNHSLNPNEPKNTPILWNDYVYATIAFINNDMSKLTFHRNIIANGSTLDLNKKNLAVVDSLIQHFGQPYSVAYHLGK
jgi:hypothetical protein